MPDLVITPASVAQVKGGRLISDRKAAVALIQGKSVYLTDANKWDLAAAELAAPIGTRFGITLAACAADQPIAVFEPITGAESHINLGATLSKGAVYFVSSNSPGGICPFADLVATDRITILGIAISSSILEMAIAWATGEQL